MKVVGLKETNLDACVSAAQHERIVITRNGKPVALVVGAGGIGFELYQIISAKKPTKETKPDQSSSKARRRSFKTYVKLTLGVVLLIGENYVFTKLFDLTFGKDLWYAVGILIDVFIFIGIFAGLIWWIDKEGRFARLMGARDDHE